MVSTCSSTFSLSSSLLFFLLSIAFWCSVSDGFLYRRDIPITTRAFLPTPTSLTISPRNFTYSSMVFRMSIRNITNPYIDACMVQFDWQITINPNKTIPFSFDTTVPGDTTFSSGSSYRVSIDPCESLFLTDDSVIDVTVTSTSNCSLTNEGYLGLDVTFVDTKVISLPFTTSVTYDQVHDNIVFYSLIMNNDLLQNVLLKIVSDKPLNWLGLVSIGSGELCFEHTYTFYNQSALSFKTEYLNYEGGVVYVGFKTATMTGLQAVLNVSINAGEAPVPPVRAPIKESTEVDVIVGVTLTLFVVGVIIGFLVWRKFRTGYTQL